MTITCKPMDADPTTGLPEYSALHERQSDAALFGGGSGRRLGGRSGFRIDTPSNVLTATSTTWTLGPCAAMIDPGFATHQGMYGWATDSNVTGSGAQGTQAADATYPRKDIVYIQIDDESAGDGSGARNAPVLYLAGSPSADPDAPDLPARSFLVGTITVPQVGGGSPTVTLNPARFVSAGARLPISSQTERDALTPYKGMEILRADLNQINASGTVERWNGTRWEHYGHIEWTTTANGLSAGTPYNYGTPTLVSGKTTASTNFVATTGGGLQFTDGGDYIVDFVTKWSGSVGTGRAFLSIEDVAAPATNVTYGRAPFGAGEDTASLSICLTVSAGQIIYPKVFQSQGLLNTSGTIRVKRVA